MRDGQVTRRAGRPRPRLHFLFFSFLLFSILLLSFVTGVRVLEIGVPNSDQQTVGDKIRLR